MDNDHGGIDEHIAGVAALKEPMRRALYEFVVRAGTGVTRDAAAESVGISRSLAAFHLDRLVDEGLLRASYHRLTGRTGPGAGRPSKLYRRANHQIDVSLPPRRYGLAAGILAEVADRLSDEDIRPILDDVAVDWGQQVAGRVPLDGSVTERLRQALTSGGYEPCETEESIRLGNCPFHDLANVHRSLVCGMNLSFLCGVLDGLGATELEAVLDPTPGFCCVSIRSSPR